MEKELPYYEVEGKYGWDQDDFPGFLMKMGGCAAVTACDSCIYLTLYKGITGLYPYDASQISREDYIQFAEEIKPYLHPRMGGINRLELYIEEFGEFLEQKKCSAVKMTPFHGTSSVGDAKEAVKRQINQGFPIPYLVLRHKDKALNDYVWHWFMLTGFRTDEKESFFVKAVSYGKALWMDFENLWDTGYENKGGMILFSF